MSAIRTIHSGHRHFGWSRDNPPALTVAPGETVEFQVVDGGGGQITPDSTAAAIAALDFATLLPLTGPIAVDGARPGDTLKITIASLKPCGWGWSGVIPGFGILADDFRDPELKIWLYDPTGREPAMFGPTARVPIKPFPGTLGLALAEPGTHSALPPRNVGGNLDTRDIAAGAELYLPVEVAGALFSIGDTHAAQGDGELAGSAIESSMDVALRFDILRGQPLDGPYFVTPGPVTRHLDRDGYYVTSGIGPDLMAAARSAVRRMIDLLVRDHHLRPVEAYMLCSVCADLRLSEVVNIPNWVVSLYFPRIVFA
ncbi:MAG: acetamidase [Alphaproteobacteria bacterium]|nr:acetamidase [Alphaproteobacteria bacterium]